ncbi:MAG TPA: magnesium transporter [Clostridia bacterium]|nr:magnesium transporter [Clostridia bacterium]
MNYEENEIALLIIKNLKEGNRKALQLLLDELHPYDIAKQYKQLSDKYKQKFLYYLSTEELTSLIQELDKDLQLEALNKLSKQKSSQVLDLMENDDIVELLSDLTDENVNEILSNMKAEESTVVKKLMNYPPESAGRIMTDRYVWVRQHYTVREAIDKLKEFAEIAESLNYLYVIDDERRIVGVVSYKDLILANLDDKIHDIMYTKVITVSALTDQEEAAKLIERYDFVSIPVVEDDNKLVGIITVDDIIDVVIEEANEDIVKLAASGKDITFKTKPFIAAWRRLPWLVVLLFIGLISGSIITGFSDTLQQVIALAAFMPMIIGMTGNTGTQSLAIVVRGLVSEELDGDLLINLILRELRVGFIIGLVCGALVSIVGFVWQGNIMLGLVVGGSLLTTLTIGTLSGTIIPLILYKLKVDPAIASGPLITTINDILGLLIYFGIASAFISIL